MTNNSKNVVWWAEGSWSGVITDRAVMLLPPDVPQDLTERLWWLLRSEEGSLTHALDELVMGMGGRLGAIPDFLLAVTTPDDVFHMALRGEAKVEVDGHPVDATGITTWFETTFTAPTSVVAHTSQKTTALLRPATDAIVGTSRLVIKGGRSKTEDGEEDDPDRAGALAPVADLGVESDAATDDADVEPGPQDQDAPQAEASDDAPSSAAATPELDDVPALSGQAPLGQDESVSPLYPDFLEEGLVEAAQADEADEAVTTDEALERALIEDAAAEAEEAVEAVEAEAPSTEDADQPVEAVEPPAEAAVLAAAAQAGGPLEDGPFDRVADPILGEELEVRLPAEVEDSVSREAQAVEEAPSVPLPDFLVESPEQPALDLLDEGPQGPAGLVEAPDAEALSDDAVEAGRTVEAGFDMPEPAAAPMISDPEALALDAGLPGQDVADGLIAPPPPPGVEDEAALAEALRLSAEDRPGDHDGRTIASLPDDLSEELRAELLSQGVSTGDSEQASVTPPAGGAGGSAEHGERGEAEAPASSVLLQEAPRFGDHDGHTVAGLPEDLVGQLVSLIGGDEKEAEQEALPLVSPAEPEAVRVVLSAVCGQGHPNPTNYTTCRECGAELNRPAKSVACPPLGRMVTSAGESVALSQPVLVGRGPVADSVSSVADVPVLPLQIPSPNQLVSRNHILIELDAWSVLAQDLGNCNGTILNREGEASVRLAASNPVLLRSGDVLDLGDGQTLTFENLP
ncbi:FHA domain-containing protein [Actinomyces slackii]|uniref:FHA domain n=1 Tax=Actinomyces slackii TaxID=52774 RepID=A0A448K9U8_9ACTO|nr:FHA domain-containing protein [Actinomyces slackii]VEG73670.1 FHA domain [Actinomyces slackii]